ncbi:hypothetical protein HK107_02855 [Parvularcula sp. ZS-1/3]|uniref:Peptidase M56 domain-containing protein n=1 Tax=Parvularcula mediterranea TaxID=2732508 RepID=A0A7Y3W487_9PROT|nr:M56 family metallopeptidase [Parvularcula mediterranea]NNU15264.1 hypothetical protein [Parvularcula mediterranea]
MTASETLIHGLETTLWVSFLIILVLALRGPVTARFGSRAAILLWALPALRLVAPVLTRKETVSVDTPLAAPAEEGPVSVASGNWAIQPAPEPLAQPAITAEPVVREAVYTYGPAETVESAPVESASAAIWPLIQSFVTEDMVAALVMSLWFVGVLTALGLCAMRGARWRRTLLAEAKDVPADLSDLAGRMAERAGTSKPFTLVVSGAAAQPQIMGLGKPILALPTDFTERYTASEQEMALLHELTHLKRGDLSVLMASEAAFALQWFNPLSRHARKALRADQEAACDEAVRDLGVNTKDYAALLLKAASNGRPVPAMTLDHSLKERIIRMQIPVSSAMKRYAFILAAGVSAIAVAGFTAGTTTVVEYQDSEDEKVEERSGGKKKASSAEDADADWARFLESLEAGGDGDAQWKAFVEKSGKPTREMKFPAEGKSSEFKRTEAARERDRAAVERVAELRRREAERAVERASRHEKQAEMRLRQKELFAKQKEEHAKAEKLRKESKLLRKIDGNLKSETRQIVVLDEGDAAFELMIDENGKLMNEKEMKRFAKKHGIELDVQIDHNDENTFRFDLDTNGKKVEIRKVEALKGQRFAFANAKTVGNGDVVFDFEDSDGKNVTIDLDGKRSVFYPKADNEGAFYVHRGDKEKVGSRWTSRKVDDRHLILMSDPFADLEMPNVQPPEPPHVEIKAPEIKEKKTDEGTWILIPDEPDMSEFEAAMEKFEARMEVFGEKMEAWGEKMGEIGETVGDLAEECEDHREESDDIRILSAKVDHSGDKVRAVCIPEGAENISSSELRSFLLRAKASPAERNFALKELRKD